MQFHIPDPMISATVEKLRKQFDRGGILGCILEEHKAVGFSLQHHFGFVQRSGVIQFRRERILVAA
jgi:hypothetical protein